MDSLRLINYRCLEDTGSIEIKPLTFLVGSNSSGKSSFLKFFPLLKQSTMIRKRGAFLWTGNEVDFKDFRNTKYHGAKSMEFELVFHQVRISKRMRKLRKSYFEKVKVHFSLEEHENEFDKISQISLELPYNQIDIRFQDKIQLSVGNVNSDFLGDRLEQTETTSLFPRLYFAKQDRSGDESFQCIEYARKIASKYNIPTNRISFFLLFSKIGIAKDEFVRRVQRAWSQTVSDQDLNVLYNLSYYYNINNIIDSVNIHIMRVAKNISYIGPLRNTTERYYRFQNYAVDEIEADGSNLAMFLYNLSNQQMNHLNQWISDVFQFTISVHSDGGHVELLVEEGDKHKENLIDIGFGYTQILPILVNMWKILYMDLKTNDDETASIPECIMAIEQPELHLHPRFQADFARILVKAINSVREVDNKEVRFVIETHSEMILNKIGEFISANQLNPYDVNVVLFNASSEHMNNYVELSNYSIDGFLTHWPIGFFSDYVD